MLVQNAGQIALVARVHRGLEDDQGGIGRSAAAFLAGICSGRLGNISITFAAIRSHRSCCKLRYELGVARRVEDRYGENSATQRNHLARVAAHVPVRVPARAL